jgi:conjugative transfer region protein (TIGR03750 family)
MSDAQLMDNELEDGTLAFMPERLNHMPVVVRGLTNDEMFVVGGISAATGFAFGIPTVILFGSFSAMATVVAAVGVLSFLIVSGTVRRMKRGKPENWFYRHVQMIFAKRHINLGAGGRVILREGRWAAENQKRMESLASSAMRRDEKEAGKKS